VTDAEVGEKIARFERVAIGNWTILYRDPSNGGLWEVFYPHGEMHGGGPRDLRSITPAQAANDYAGV
jgi:hypothetical protein